MRSILPAPSTVCSRRIVLPISGRLGFIKSEGKIASVGISDRGGVWELNMRGVQLKECYDRKTIIPADTCIISSVLF